MGSGREDGPEAVVARFNDCINRRDLDGLARMMADDHVFIDSAGGRVDGRESCLAAWRGFFDAYPDYRNVFFHVSERRRGGGGGTVGLLGAGPGRPGPVDGQGPRRPGARVARL